MKAVVVGTPGGPEVLEVVERPKPVLKAGWTLVKIKALASITVKFLPARDNHHL